MLVNLRDLSYHNAWFGLVIHGSILVWVFETMKKWRAKTSLKIIPQWKDMIIWPKKALFWVGFGFLSFGVNVGIFSHPRKQRPTGWHHILGISVKAGEISRNMCGKKPRPCISPTDGILSTNGSMLQCMDWNCHLGFCFYVSKSNYMCICGGIHPYSEAFHREYLEEPDWKRQWRYHIGWTSIEFSMNRVLCWLSRCTIFFCFENEDKIFRSLFHRFFPISESLKYF